MKDFIKVFAIPVTVLLSSCASTTHVACDFAGGAIDNAGERHRNKGQVDIYGNTVKKHQNTDIVAGILSIIVGAINRALDDEAEGCT